jgi:hypothetical protein
MKSVQTATGSAYAQMKVTVDGRQVLTDALSIRELVTDRDVLAAR